MEKRFKRRQFFIRGSIQTKYAIIMLALFSFAAVVVWWETYRSLISLVEDGIVKEPTILPTLHQMSRTLAFKIMLLLGGVWVFSILALHLVAGPIYRVEAMLRLMKDGNFRERVRLRKDDELKHVANTFNETLDALQSLVDRDRRRIEALSQKLGTVSSSADANVARELRAIAKELGAVTQEFTI